MINLQDRAQEREIDGVTYRVWPVPFKVGKSALVRLVGVLSPVLAGALRERTKEDMVAAVFQALPSSLSDADLDYFARLFGDASQYKNEAGDWAPLIEKVQASHFECRYAAYLRWIAFACEVNFSGFFTGITNGGIGVDVLRMTMPK